MHFTLHELDLSSWGTVTAIEPCPPIAAGQGQVVTGRFTTRQVEEITRVQLEDGTELSGTPVHPVWSVDRQDWIPLGSLQPAERLLSRLGEVAVTSVATSLWRQPVYNLEVHGEHVYEVADAGVLVHNAKGPNQYSTNTLKSAGDLFEERVKQTFGKKIIRQNEKLGGGLIGEIDFEILEAIVEVGISLRGKTRQLHKLAEIAASRAKRLYVIYGPDTAPGTLKAIQSSLSKKWGNRVRFFPHE